MSRLPDRPSRAERAELLELFREMWLLRAFEEVAAAAHGARKLPGLLHLSIGAEAVAVGVISHLGPGDRVYSTHRPHGHFLAAGADPRALMAELAGRETGLCRGRAGSMHLMSHRAVLATGVVGGTLPIAVGHGLALEEGNVVISFFGDGAAQTGVFSETLNLASLWNAPVLFVCENNGWAEFSPREEHTKVASVAAYGSLFGMSAATVDGADVEQVLDAAASLIRDIRAGSGPALLECTITRLRPHYEGDLRGGDPDHGGDPVVLLGERLAALGVDPEDLAEVKRVAMSSAERALEQALDDPPPRAEDVQPAFARPLP